MFESTAMITENAKSSLAMPTPASDTIADPRWARVIARDKTADGEFWYSVATTGVYCRPSCPSRGANPKNVRFHTTIEDAQTAGFRPCKRCKPDGASVPDANTLTIAKACSLIEQSETEPSLQALAEAAGLSVSYFHRLFKASTGLTPREYGAAHKAARVRKGLEDGQSVTQTLYNAGFNSSGRFYAKSTSILGMTPTRYRAGGDEEKIHFAVGQSSLGSILVASSQHGVAAIFLGDDPDLLVRKLQDRFPKAALIGGDRDYEALVASVVTFVENPVVGLDLPLDVRGTAFQQRVWQALQAIPAGETASYAEVAHRIGNPKAARAVARACAANGLAVAIPCHRVVHTSGNGSGYAWGVERKRRLLERERAQPS
jgi:AraC family transcriptional regulator, regulatory protein of adaptative response / methylated-DNA-[protein]-cysteine methyltransferase